MSRLAVVALVVPILAGPLFARGVQDSKITRQETAISIDVKDVDVVDVLRLLAEIGQFNLVADANVSCKTTLALKAVPWTQVLDLILKTCRLGQDRLGTNLVRIASIEALRQELEHRRKYEEEKALSGELTTRYHRLSYARARELTAVLEKFLSPRGSITFDERTNTLIITDIR